MTSAAVTLHSRGSHLVFSSSRGLSSFPCAWFQVEGAGIDLTEDGFEVVFAELPKLTHGNVYVFVRGASVTVCFRLLGELSSQDIFRLRQLDLVS